MSQVVYNWPFDSDHRHTMPNTPLQIRIGFFTATGKRECNEDYVAVYDPRNHRVATQGIAAVIADGVGGHAGGRVAAELAVRGFIDAYFNLPETLGVEHAAARALTSINRWITMQGRNDSVLKAMATTFSALILRGRQAHVLHVGDTRVYRLRERQLDCLTQDHTHQHPDLNHVLYRAVGLEDSIRADYQVHALEVHDRYVLCCDGVYEALPRREFLALLARRSDPQEDAQRLVQAALDAGSNDNATALVVDIIGLPDSDQADLERMIEALPLMEPPKVGDQVDGFEMLEEIFDGRYSRLLKARDMRDERIVALKFPQPRVADDASYRRAFVREAWIAARVHSPFVVKVLELSPGRQTRLYSVLPFYAGKTLEQRITSGSRINLTEGVELGIKLCKAVGALNRLRIVHRDIKPDNIMLEINGGMKLLDLGVARLPGMREAPDEDIPGTPSYMAPELFAGEHGDERSDVYALGVTLYRLFSGHYPYGEVEAFSTPRFNKRTLLAQHRPDLPAWLDYAVSKAVHIDPTQRHADSMELAFELENGLARGGGPAPYVKRALLERNPVLFWQLISVVLLIVLIVVLATK